MAKKLKSDAARRFAGHLMVIGAATLLAPSSMTTGPAYAATLRPQIVTNESGDVDTIIVNGRRYSKRLPRDFKVEPNLAKGRARHADRADRFAKCMRFLDPDLLRKAIDGPVHYSSSTFALGRLIQKNIGCYPDFGRTPPPGAQELGSCNAMTVDGMVNLINGTIKECRAPYDRAAIVRRVIKKYDSDLALTTAETSDPVVQSRFDAREVPLNRLRRGDDKLMFEIAVCMVRLQPETSVRLVDAKSTGEQYAVEAAIIDGARTCIGGAKRLGVDPAEFRDYISDAVYRWEVASKDVSSLISDKG